MAAGVKALKARLVTSCQADSQATPDATQISEIGTMCWRSVLEWPHGLMRGLSNSVQASDSLRFCFGDDEHGCVMVDAVGSGHLAVSECRLNIGHAIPHRTRAIPKPYQVIPHQNLWHSTQCTIEYWLGPLGRANCPGAPLWLAPLCCLITLHCIATLADQNTSAHCSSGNSRTPLT